MPKIKKYLFLIGVNQVTRPAPNSAPIVDPCVRHAAVTSRVRITRTVAFLLRYSRQSPLRAVALREVVTTSFLAKLRRLHSNYSDETERISFHSSSTGCVPRSRITEARKKPARLPGAHFA
jgi:hypothetical protein